jgi:hypothetical protein
LCQQRDNKNVLKSKEWKYKFILGGIKMFSKCVLCYFAYLVGLDVYGGVLSL